MKHIWSGLLRLAISIGAIVLVLWTQRAHLDEAVFVLRNDVNWWWFLAALFVYLCGIFITSIRLYCVLRTQEIRISLPNVVYLTYVGIFFNLFLPSAVGGDIAKAYYLARYSNDKVGATTAVIWDRLMGFAALILMALVALGSFSREINDGFVNRMVYIFLFVFFGLIFFFLNKRFARLFKGMEMLIPSVKWRQRLRDIYHALYQFKKHKKMMAATFALSLVGQALFVLLHYLLTRSLGQAINPWLFFILIPILSIISMIPSIGGLGVREMGVSYLFLRYMPGERALALSLLLDILIYGVSLLSGLMFALRGGLKPKEILEMEELG